MSHNPRSCFSVSSHSCLFLKTPFPTVITSQYSFSLFHNVFFGISLFLVPIKLYCSDFLSTFVVSVFGCVQAIFVLHSFLLYLV